MRPNDYSGYVKSNLATEPRSAVKDLSCNVFQIIRSPLFRRVSSLKMFAERLRAGTFLDLKGY